MTDLRLTDMPAIAAADVADGDTAYLVHSNADKKITVADFAKAIRSRAVVQAAYSTVIPLNDQTLMAEHAIDGAIAFTAAPSPVAGARCYLRLEADGTHEPAFSGFIEHSSSIGFVNTAGVMNYVWFWYDGEAAFYAVSTAKVDAPFDGGGVSKFNVILAGDSIGASPHAAFLSMDFDPENVRLTNAAPLAVPGTTLQGLVAGPVNQGGLGSDGYGPWYDPSRVNVAIIQRGTNDLGNRSPVNTLASTVYADLTSEVAKAKRAGFIVAVCTVLPRSSWGGDGNARAAQLSAYNALVRNNTAGADAICDLNAIPALADATNTTLYLDGLHPTAAGDAAMVSTYKAATSAAMAHSRREPQLQAIALDRSIFPDTPTSGAITGTTYGSLITTTVAGLTIHSAARTFDWDGTGSAGTTVAGLSENLWGELRGSPVTVQSGSAPNWLRLPPRLSQFDGFITYDVASKLDETGNDSSGYTYEVDQSYPSNPGQQYYLAAGYPNKRLPANAEGWIQMVVDTPSLQTAAPGMYLVEVLEPASFVGPDNNGSGQSQKSRVAIGVRFFYGAFQGRPTAVAGNYPSDYRLPPGGTPEAEPGDILRLERTISGGVATLAVKLKKGSAAFVTIDSVTGSDATLAELCPYFYADPAGAKIAKPQASANVA